MLLKNSTLLPLCNGFCVVFSTYWLRIICFYWIHFWRIYFDQLVLWFHFVMFWGFFKLQWSHNYSGTICVFTSVIYIFSPVQICTNEYFNSKYFSAMGKYFFPCYLAREIYEINKSTHGVSFLVVSYQLCHTIPFLSFNLRDALQHVNSVVQLRCFDR